MRTIEKYVTFDGVEHATQQQASRHLENEWARRVTALGHKFAPAGIKYSQFSKLIEDNLSEFVELLKVKIDMEVKDE